MGIGGSTRQGATLSEKEPLTMGEVTPVELDELGFVLTELRPGGGRMIPRKGDEATFAFECWLDDGTSVGRSSLVKSKVGVGRLIRGLDKALLKMSVGQKCKLLCSPNHGYGLFAVPGTPVGPSSILIFEVDLLDVTRHEDLPKAGLSMAAVQALVNAGLMSSTGNLDNTSLGSTSVSSMAATYPKGRRQTRASVPDPRNSVVGSSAGSPKHLSLAQDSRATSTLSVKKARSPATVSFGGSVDDKRGGGGGKSPMRSAIKRSSVSPASFTLTPKARPDVIPELPPPTVDLGALPDLENVDGDGSEGGAGVMMQLEARTVPPPDDD